MGSIKYSLFLFKEQCLAIIFFALLANFFGLAIPPHSQDIMGEILDPQQKGMKALIFFTKEQKDKMLKSEARALEELYLNKNIHLVFILHKKGLHPLMRKKIRKNLQKNFILFTEERQKHIQEKDSTQHVLPPQNYFYIDWKNGWSHFYKIGKPKKLPLFILLDEKGTEISRIYTREHSPDKLREKLKEALKKKPFTTSLNPSQP